MFYKKEKKVLQPEIQEKHDLDICRQICVYR